MKKLLLLVFLFAPALFAQTGAPITVGPNPVPVYSPGLDSSVSIVQTAGNSSAYTVYSVSRQPIANKGAGTTYTFSPAPAASFNLGQPMGFISIPTGTSTFTTTGTPANGIVQNGTGAPSGACLLGTLYTNNSNGDLYSCDGGVWVKVGSSVSPITGTIAANQVAYGTGANVIGGITAPAIKGGYACGYTLSSDAAAAPTCPQIGFFGRTVTGLNPSDTILYSDYNKTVDYEPAGTAAVSLPTPTTLENSNFGTTLYAGGLTIITPVTWNIRTAAVYSSTLTMNPGDRCRIQIDPQGGNHWFAACSNYGAVVSLVFPVTVSNTTSGGIPYFSSTTALSTSALLTSNSPVLGGGSGGAPATATFLTTDGASTLTIGVIGGGNGALALAGNTSGTATFTAPAVAGTTSNPVASSNFLTVPTGTQGTPSYTFAGETGYGMNYDATGGRTGVDIDVNGGNALTVSTAQIEVQSSTSYAWGPSTNPTATPDTTISRAAAGYAQIGTSSANASGVLLSANKSFVTTDFTDSTSTALQLITGLSYTLPTSKAVNLSFHCVLNYDQATALVSDSFGVGVTGTAPTNLSASGVVYVSTSTLTEGTLTALASTTPTAVVTFTPTGSVATVYRAELDGTVEQPSNATPGVFSVYVSTTTGTDNIIVKRGSYCSLF